jgi:hypothetical protein
MASREAEDARCYPPLQWITHVHFDEDARAHWPARDRLDSGQCAGSCITCDAWQNARLLPETPEHT